MEKKYRKTGLAVLVSLLILLAAWAVFAIAGRFSGSLDTLELPTEITDKVDQIEMRFSDTCFLRFQKKEGVWQGGTERFSFEADMARIQDFLGLFNTWEILMIPSDSQRRAWQAQITERGGKVCLKAGGRKVFAASFVHTGGYFVIDQGRQKVYAMDMPYNPSDNRRFFAPEPDLWQNRLLFHFDYDGLASVKVTYPDKKDSYRLLNTGKAFLLEHEKGVDTVPAARARAYLSSFTRVYFDAKDAGNKAEGLLYEMEICPKEGDCMTFPVFGKLTDGTPDVFKALTVVRRSSGTDTVEIPYVVLDKLVKRPSWFGLY